MKTGMKQEIFFKHFKVGVRDDSCIRAIVSQLEMQITKLRKVWVHFIGYSSLELLFIVKLIEVLRTILVC